MPGGENNKLKQRPGIIPRRTTATVIVGLLLCYCWSFLAVPRDDLVWCEVTTIYPTPPSLPQSSQMLTNRFYKRRRKVPGGAAGLQNQSGSRKVPGGFDSLPSPPRKFFYIQQLTFALYVCSPSVAQNPLNRSAIIHGSIRDIPICSSVTTASRFSI